MCETASGPLDSTPPPCQGRREGGTKAAGSKRSWIIVFWRAGDPSIDHYPSVCGDRRRRTRPHGSRSTPGSWSRCQTLPTVPPEARLIANSPPLTGPGSCFGACQHLYFWRRIMNRNWPLALPPSDLSVPCHRSIDASPVLVCLLLPSSCGPRSTAQSPDSSAVAPRSSATAVQYPIALQILSFVRGPDLELFSISLDNVRLYW